MEKKCHHWGIHSEMGENTLCNYILSVPQGPCVKVWSPVRWRDFREVSASGRCSGQQGSILEGHSGTQDPSSLSPSFPSQKMVSCAPAHSPAMMHQQRPKSTRAHLSCMGTSGLWPSLTTQAELWSLEHTGRKERADSRRLSSHFHMHDTACEPTRQQMNAKRHETSSQPKEYWPTCQ